MNWHIRSLVFLTDMSERDSGSTKSFMELEEDVFDRYDFSMATGQRG